MFDPKAIPGGAILALTTSPVNIDMSMFAGQYVSIEAPAQEVLLCATDSSTDTAILVVPTAISVDANVPEFIHAHKPLTVLVPSTRFPG